VYVRDINTTGSDVGGDEDFEKTIPGREERREGRRRRRRRRREGCVSP